MIAERYQKIRFEAGLAQGLEQGLEQGREQGLAQGQERGQEEERAQWVAWNRRRLAAEERGERFVEPPPADDDGQTAQEDVLGQRLLQREQQRAEFWRALWIALMVILCTLAATLWAIAAL